MMAGHGFTAGRKEHRFLYAAKLYDDADTSAQNAVIRNGMERSLFPKVSDHKVSGSIDYFLPELGKEKVYKRQSCLEG
jgi:hypothetical protein